MENAVKLYAWHFMAWPYLPPDFDERYSSGWITVPNSLFDRDKVVQTNPDMDTLTARYTERAVAFIRRAKDRPFFLYVPHSMPHVPLGASAPYRGRSKAGLYGDVIEEIDGSVGQILAALKETGLDDSTLVIFTSDNGPWLSYGDHAGSAS